jgi:hypothetical protein
MAMATAKLSSPATSLLAGGRARRSAPARRATVIRAAAGSYSDELVSTAVSPERHRQQTLHLSLPFGLSGLTARRRTWLLECCTCLTRRSVTLGTVLCLYLLMCERGDGDCSAGLG